MDIQHLSEQAILIAAAVGAVGRVARDWLGTIHVTVRIERTPPPPDLR